jgi:hypothetical protein
VSRDAVCGRFVAEDRRIAAEEVAEPEVLERVADQPVPRVPERLIIMFRALLALTIPP